MSYKDDYNDSFNSGWKTSEIVGYVKREIDKLKKEIFELKEEIKKIKDER